MSVDTAALGLALFDNNFVQDPYPLYAQMHQQGAVHRIGDSQFYAVSGWQAIYDVLSRPEDFSSNLTSTMTYHDGRIEPFFVGELGSDIQALATADDPAHALHRRLLVPQLAARRINALEQYVTEITEQLWHNATRGNSVEWMSVLANQLPMMVVTRLIGVPDPDIDQLVRWGYASTQVVEGLANKDELAAAGVAIMELSAYVNQHFQQAATAGEDNLLGTLARARDRGEISEITALAMMLTLFGAGGESTASLIGSAAYVLATKPDIQRTVRADPATLPSFLEEVLRYEPPFRGHYRHVIDKTELCGHTVPKDSHLVLLWAAANRDPSHFQRPDEFRIDRPNGKGHLAFGKGAHFCVGAALARLEAKIVIADLLARTSWIEPVTVGKWLPSLLVRRLESLHLSIR